MLLPPRSTQQASFPANRLRLPFRDPLTLGRRGPAARQASPGTARRARLRTLTRPAALQRRPGQARERRFPSPRPYNLITRDIKLSSRSLIIMRVIGTQHAASCVDSQTCSPGQGVCEFGGRGGSAELFLRNTANPPRATRASCREKDLEECRLGF